MGAMPARFDMNLLSVAVAICETGSVSAAARRLAMSQPAVSTALNKLRAALGDPLFVRTPKGMEPTPRAVAVAASMKEVLARVESEVLAKTEFAPARSTHAFTFALSDIGDMVFLPRLVEALRVEAPHSSVKSVSLSPPEIERGLQFGDIDLAVGFFPDLRGASFFQQRLFSHTFVCLMRADHPIAGHRLTVKQFLALEHAVVRASGRSQEVFERFLERKRLRRRIVLYTPHFMSIPMVIAKSDLVVTVPLAVGTCFARSGHIKLVRLPFDIPKFDLKQHWHRRYHHDARNRWIRGLVARLFNDEVDEWKDYERSL
jgi:DNA-binding transcriptional LysR family regulator